MRNPPYWVVRYTTGHLLRRFKSSYPCTLGSGPPVRLNSVKSRRRHAFRVPVGPRLLYMPISAHGPTAGVQIRGKPFEPRNWLTLSISIHVEGSTGRAVARQYSIHAHQKNTKPNHNETRCTFSLRAICSYVTSNFHIFLCLFYPHTQRRKSPSTCVLLSTVQLLPRKPWTTILIERLEVSRLSSSDICRNRRPASFASPRRTEPLITVCGLTLPANRHLSCAGVGPNHCACPKRFVRPASRYESRLLRHPVSIMGFQRLTSTSSRPQHTPTTPYSLSPMSYETRQSASRISVWTGSRAA